MIFFCQQQIYKLFCEIFHNIFTAHTDKYLIYSSENVHVYDTQWHQFSLRNILHDISGLDLIFFKCICRSVLNLTVNWPNDPDDKFIKPRLFSWLTTKSFKNIFLLESKNCLRECFRGMAVPENLHNFLSLLSVSLFTRFSSLAIITKIKIFFFIIFSIKECKSYCVLSYKNLLPLL